MLYLFEFIRHVSLKRDWWGQEPLEKDRKMTSPQGVTECAQAEKFSVCGVGCSERERSARGENRTLQREGGNRHTAKPER